MMSAAFTACSSSNNDDDGGGGTPPQPEPKAQTVTIDGAEKPILKAEYYDNGDGNYFLFLYLSADSKEKMELHLNKDLHMSGSPIDLTKREKKHEGDEWYWVADYHNPNNSLFTNTTGNPDSNSGLYTTGTLTVTGDPQSGKVSIKLENGRVKTNNREEHTLVLSYSGPMTKIGGGTTPDPKPTMEYVDLGLPSGLKWAKCNLGASKPTDYGDYYAWGETEPNKAEYTWATYKWGTEDNITKYNDTDDKTTLKAADDAATQKLGSPWRMPTIDEINELIGKCIWTETTQNGVKGHEVKGPNDNSIFLPAAGGRNGSELKDAGSWGAYWSSSLHSAYISNAYALYLYFVSDGHYWYDGASRYFGFPVRPVRP